MSNESIPTTSQGAGQPITGGAPAPANTTPTTSQLQAPSQAGSVQAQNQVQAPSVQASPTEAVQNNPVNQQSQQATNTVGSETGNGTEVNQGAGTTSEVNQTNDRQQPTDLGSILADLNDRESRAAQTDQPSDANDGGNTEQQSIQAGDNAGISDNQGQAVEGQSTEPGGTESSQMENGDASGSVGQFNRDQYFKDLGEKVNLEVQKRIDNSGIQEKAMNSLLDKEALEEGRRVFVNPDTGKVIDRFEAQKWVDTLVDRVRQDEYKKIVESIKPSIDAQIFIAEKWPHLSDEVKAELDKVVAPYAILNEQGQVCGYKINLDTAAEYVETKLKADKYDRMTQPKGATTSEHKEEEPEETPAGPVTQPSLDAKTSSSVTQPVANTEGKVTLEEAKSDLGKALQYFDENPDQLRRRGF